MKVLIVDDEVECAAALVMLLRPAGYDVSAETDPLKAFNKIKKTNPDVVITDLNMPKLNGIELINLVNKINGKCRTIIISSSEFDFITHDEREKIHAVLCKPIDSVSLIDLVKKIELEIKK